MIFVAAAAVVGAFLVLSKNRIAEEVNAVSMSNPADWKKFDELFKKSAAKHGVDWMHLKAIAMNESSLGKHPSVVRGMQNPYDIEGSKSSDGKSWGLMQVTVTTARDMDPLANEIKLNNPEYSIELAAKYFAWLKRYFKDGSFRQLEWLVKSYNQGAGNSIKERDGKSAGFAHEYWERFKRNLERVKENP